MFLHFLKFKLGANSLTESFLCYVMSVYLPCTGTISLSQVKWLVKSHALLSCVERGQHLRRCLSHFATGHQSHKDANNWAAQTLNAECGPCNLSNSMLWWQCWPARFKSHLCLTCMEPEAVHVPQLLHGAQEVDLSFRDLLWIQPAGLTELCGFPEEHACGQSQHCHQRSHTCHLPQEQLEYTNIVHVMQYQMLSNNC